MKKSIFILTMLSICMVAFCQADSTLISMIQGFGVDGKMASIIAVAVSWIVGHFILNQKWTSYTLWLEKIVYYIWQGLHWFNNRTNKGQINSSK